MRVEIVLGDVIKLQMDAIVNAAFIAAARQGGRWRCAAIATDDG